MTQFLSGAVKTRYYAIPVLLLLLVLFSATDAQAQVYAEGDMEKDGYELIIDNSLGSQWKSTRGYSLPGKISSIEQDGLAKYFRFTVMDGNLVSGGYSSSGLLSYHYVSGCPRTSWPKGSQLVEYVHGVVFYVAGEVIDARGDTIQIVSDNYRRSSAERSTDATHWYAFMPLPGYFNTRATNSIEWDMEGVSEDVGIDGFPGTFDEGEGDGVLQTQEDINGNGILDDALINEVNWFAVSHRKDTWPTYWPVGSYPGDTRSEGQAEPGVRAGRWNGEYGSYIRADQESYYVMDDRENDEFEYYPFPEISGGWPNGRRGLGVTVEVRNYQWAARLAEDIVISIFDITNKGKDLPKCVVGMYVDPDMGGFLEGDDASFDEVDDITYAWNRVGFDRRGIPVGYFGFAFLESPGLSRDGIDNDEDGIIDETQTNDIDEDGDWRTWSDDNNNGMFDTEDYQGAGFEQTNYNGVLDPGEDANGNGILDIEPIRDDVGSDGLGPFSEGYPGPDPDGSEANGVPDQGEPNFGLTDNDESDQVGLTSFYLRDVQDVMAEDERYWKEEIVPGNFTVKPDYQRDIAWTYGSGYVEILSGEEGAQRYAISLLFGNDEPDILRNKRTMQVIYDEDYNFARPPRKPFLTASVGDQRVVLTWDDGAERSRDPIYGNDFEAYYVLKSLEPSFNDIKTITDAFGNPLLFQPVAIYDVKNGLTGMHPVRIGSELGPDSDLGVSYYLGDDSGLEHHYIDTNVVNGRSYYYAVVAVDRGYHPSFYTLGVSEREGLQEISPTESGVNIQVDPLGRAIAYDRNAVQVIPEEVAAGWIAPEVVGDTVVHVAGAGDGFITVEVVDPVAVLNGTTYRIDFDDDRSYEELHENFTGKTAFVTLNHNGQLLTGITDPDNNDRSDEFIYDGIKINIHNRTQVTLKDTFWVSGSSNLILVDNTEENNLEILPRDYELRVLEDGADTAQNQNYVTNFQLWDVTDPANPFRLSYRFLESRTDPEETMNRLSLGDRITLRSELNRAVYASWEMGLPEDLEAGMEVNPQSGDVYRITTIKPFDRNDSFEFSVSGNVINDLKAGEDMSDIYTVPDPYIAVNLLERQVINEAEGRGDRRVDFVNLPTECTIKIFTVSGKLVRTLEHQSPQEKSRISWDLRTKDGLEVSHGVYFWLVDAPGVGTATGKMAIIK